MEASRMITAAISPIRMIQVFLLHFLTRISLVAAIVAQIPKYIVEGNLAYGASVGSRGSPSAGG
jgi:hypothetical protein